MKKSLLILTLIGLSLSISQAQKVEKVVSVVPDGLFKALAYPERQSTTHLTLTGSIDARDFKTMRDAMPQLQVVDLSKVSIVEFSGQKGTEEGSGKYKANYIPQNAFSSTKNSFGKRSIVEIILPSNLEGIGDQAFLACYGLEKVVIPASVKEIGMEAFSRCQKLTSVTAVSPKPITDMGKGVFLAVNMNACTLYVPKGSADAYKAAKQWKEFFNVEEVQIGPVTALVDSDGDGIPDDMDKCNNTPAAAMGKVDANGCPLDSDGDGIPDYLDQCNNTPAAAMGKTDGRGCPIDSDGDGVPDYLDQCNNTPIAAMGKVDAKGCPLDSDGDGIPDYADNCPDVAGVPSNGGCPEVKAEVKQVFEKALTGIEFETGKDVIKASSNGILDEIASIMKENPTYTLLINGHTDNVGDRNANLILSEKRANAVKFYLLGKGIDSHRMIASGYGDTRPVADNTTEAGRAKNRRVEFVAKISK